MDNESEMWLDEPNCDDGLLDREVLEFDMWYLLKRYVDENKLPLKLNRDKWLELFKRVQLLPAQNFQEGTRVGVEYESD